MRRRRRLVVAVLLGLASLALVWLASTGPRPEGLGSVDALETRPAGEPGLAPHPVDVGRAPDAPDPATTAPSVAKDADAGARRVRVRGADGKALAANVTLFGGGRTFPLVLGPDGTVEVTAEAERFGFDRLNAHIEPAGGPSVVVLAPGLSAREVVVTVPEGRELTGRVLDLATRIGIADLPIVASSWPGRRYAVFPEDVDVAAWARAHPHEAEFPSLVHASTDAEGRFRIRVASALVRVVVDPTTASGRAWFVPPPESLSGATEWTLYAVPAATVEGTVTDAGTGDLLPASGVTVRLGRTERGAAFLFGMHAVDGSFRATCDRRGSLDSALAGSVSAWAEGLVPLEIPVVWAATERTARADLRLQPLAATGGTVATAVEIHDADGDPSDLPWFLEVATPTEDRRRLSVIGLVRDAPGRYTAAVPPGEWSLRVLLPQHFADLYAAAEIVRVEAEHPPTLRLQVPRGGPVVLTSTALSGDLARGGLMLQTPREGTSWWRGESVPATSKEIRFHALPEAPREMRLSDGKTRDGAAVVVRPTKGHESMVEVPAP